MDPLDVEIFQKSYWIQNCDRLKYCADALAEKLLSIKDEKAQAGNSFEHYNKIRALLETNKLLLGYALENLLKGYLIHRYLRHEKIPRHCDLKFVEKEIWKTKKTHDLIILTQNAKLKLSSSENNMLELLTKYTTWKGRYHIPRNSDDIFKHIQPGLGDTHTSKDTEIVEGLIERIKNEFRN